MRVVLMSAPVHGWRDGVRPRALSPGNLCSSRAMERMHAWCCVSSYARRGAPTVSLCFVIHAPRAWDARPATSFSVLGVFAERLHGMLVQTPCPHCVYITSRAHARGTPEHRKDVVSAGRFFKAQGATKIILVTYIMLL